MSSTLKKIIKLFLIATGVLAASGGALASTTQSANLEEKTSLVQSNKKGIKNKQSPVRVFQWFSYEIPRFFFYKLDIKQVSNESIKSALQNPETISRIEELLEEDRKNDLTEIGGIVTYVKGENKLNFYPIESTNYRHAKEIREALNKNDLTPIIKIFENNWDEVIFVCPINRQNLMDYLLSNRKLSFEKSIEILARGYIMSSDGNYTPYPEDYMKFYKEHFLKLKGKFVGAFHFHEDGTIPSNSDVYCSKFERQMVISKKKEGVKVFEIKKGKETLIYNK